MKLKLHNISEIATLKLFTENMRNTIQINLNETEQSTPLHYSLQAEYELIDVLVKTLAKKLIDQKQKASIPLLKATALVILKYNHTETLPGWSKNALMQQTNAIHQQFVNP